MAYTKLFTRLVDPWWQRRCSETVRHSRADSFQVSIWPNEESAKRPRSCCSHEGLGRTLLPLPQSPSKFIQMRIQGRSYVGLQPPGQCFWETCPWTTASVVLGMCFEMKSLQLHIDLYWQVWGIYIYIFLNSVFLVHFKE